MVNTRFLIYFYFFVIFSLLNLSLKIINFPGYNKGYKGVFSCFFMKKPRIPQKRGGSLDKGVEAPNLNGEKFYAGEILVMDSQGVKAYIEKGKLVFKYGRGPSINGRKPVDYFEARKYIN